MTPRRMRSPGRRMAKRSGRRGFMVISFVLVLSVVMLGTLRSLAALASEQTALEFEIAGRQHADAIALDCAYMLARVLAVQATIRDFEDKAVPVMDGSCTVSELREQGVSQDISEVGMPISEMRVVGTDSVFTIRAEYGSFHSKINPEIQTKRGAVDFIKI